MLNGLIVWGESYRVRDEEDPASAGQNSGEKRRAMVREPNARSLVRRVNHWGRPRRAVQHDTRRGNSPIAGTRREYRLCARSNAAVASCPIRRN